MLEEALRDLPPVPPARPEFRSSLKSAFASGELAASEPEQASVRPTVRPTVRQAPRRRSGRGPRSPERTHPFSSGPFSWQVVTGLVAVAAAVVLLVTTPRDGGAEQVHRSWKVAALGSELEVDRVRIPTADGAQLVRAVNGAHTLASLNASVQLELAQELRMAMEPSSSLELPTGDALDEGTSIPRGEATGKGASGDELDFRLSSGTLHLMTAHDYDGEPIVVETPHAKVRIRGSVLSIEIFEGKGTCICVAHGEANVEVLRGSQQALLVHGNSTCFVFADDTAPAHGPWSQMVSQEHLQPLLDFYDETF